MNFLKNCSPYLLPQWRWVLIIVFCTILDTAFIALSPLSFKFLIDEAFIPKDSEMFLFIIVVLLTGGGVALLAGFVSDYAMTILSGRIAFRLRNQAFSKVQTLSLENFNKYGIGTLVSRFSDDIPSIEDILAYFIPAVFQGVFSVVIGVVLLLQMQWKLTLLMMACSSILLLGPLLLKNRSKKASELFKEEQEAFIDLVDESVRGHQLIKGYQLATFMEERAKPRIHAIWKSGVRMNVLFSLMERIPATSQLILSAVMISVGGYFIFQGGLSIGEFIAMNTVFMSISQSLLSLSLLWPQLLEAEVSLNRVNELLHTETEKLANTKTTIQQLPTTAQTIYMKNVYFRYTDEQNAIENISLTIPANRLTVFVGTSGSGKSTALKLLLRFYQPSEGNIFYGDIDLHNELNEQSFYEQVSIVFQDSHFFQMSIQDNLTLGNDNIDQQSIEQAAKQAYIHDTIMSMPDQYNTIIQHNGNNLSGGQKQRLAIARALAKNPNYLFLDEASSALDPATEADLNGMIQNLRGQKTVVSVTHRLLSAVHADQIYVFKDGEIVESGTHATLLEHKGLYKQLWDKQNGFEISNDGFQAKITVHRLAQFSFFQNLNVDVLMKISNQFVTENYAPSQTIIQEGEQGDKFYIIVRGSVEVMKGHKTVAILEDGDHFGEIALLKNIPRTATIVAKAPSIILSLRREQLLELTQSNEEIFNMLEKTILQRMSS